MPEPNRVVIDRIDWKSVLPALRLASAFKHALQPGKLLVALIAVLAIHLSGTALDLMWPNEDIVVSGPELNITMPQQDPYESFIDNQSFALQRLAQSAIALDFYYSSGPRNPSATGVIGWLRAVVVDIPIEYFEHHPWFMLLFGADVLFILAMASGILCRMSATQVCVERSTPLASAACFVRRRWAWFLLTPLMPTMLIIVVGALLALMGLIFFNVPWLDVAGSALYGLFLLLGFMVAIVSLLVLLALFLMPPALSVEGSDGFDAIARSFNYILFRPWQFGGYLFASIVYLALIYVVVGTVASLSIDASGYFIGLGVVGDAELTEPAAWILARWSELVTAVVLAIMLSTFCCLQTQVYVLMRRSADGTPLDQCDGDDAQNLWAETLTPEQPDDSGGTDDTAKAEG